MTTYTNAMTTEVIDLASCEDGAVLGLSPNGSVLQWSPDDGVYDSGESLAEYGPHNIRPHERARVGLVSAAA